MIEFNCNKDFLRERGNRTEHLGLHFNLDIQTPSTRLANMAQNGQNEAFRMLEELSELSPLCSPLGISTLPVVLSGQTLVPARSSGEAQDQESRYPLSIAGLADNPLLSS